MDADSGIAPTTRTIRIMRVSNGWVVRTESMMSDGVSLPIMISETPGRLAEIISEWANAQHLAAQLSAPFTTSAQG